MKAVHVMLNEHLPRWAGHASRPEVAEALRLQAWTAFLRIPECWEVRGRAGRGEGEVGRYRWGGRERQAGR